MREIGGVGSRPLHQQDTRVKELANELHYAASVGDAFASLCPRDARSFEGPLGCLRDAFAENTSAHFHAIFDNSRVPGCLDFVEAIPLECRCLLAPELGRGIRHVAPYLMTVPDLAVLTSLFEMTWGRKAVIFLRSDRTALSLATHLRQFAVATLPNGELSIFRYYDPAIFRVFLDTITAEQYRRVFPGHIDAALFEGPRSRLTTAILPMGGPDQIEIRQC